MNNKKTFRFLMMMVSLITFSMVGFGCGSDGDDPEPAAKAPTVVSTSPGNNATDVSPGTIQVQITYDQTVSLDKSKSLTISGASVKGDASVVGKVVTIPVECSSYETKVTITLPEGYVYVTGAKAAAYTFSFTTEKAPAVVEFEPASAAVKKMIAGWNLGNTLEAWNASIIAGSATSKYETCWGQPVTEEFLLKKFKEKGFTAIRVPVSWFQKMDEAGNVREDWMDRVETVVKYVLNNGMYCILNVHHDTGAGSQAWLKAETANYTVNSAKFKKLWTQIANRFKNYNETLLFEGYNEMLAGTDGVGTGAQWNQPTDLNNLQAINNYAKDFVEAVRATGGNNLYRNLVVTTYSAAHSGRTLTDFVVPTDPCGNQKHLAVEIHSYDPWDWVNKYKMKWTSECTAEITNMFKDLNTYFISKGYPVIVGEYGSNGNNEKSINGSSSNAEKIEAAKQASEMTKLCKQYGAAGFYWMGIVDGKDREEATFKWSMEQVANAIVNASK